MPQVMPRLFSFGNMRLEHFILLTLQFKPALCKRNSQGHILFPLCVNADV
jgi:hypothetical protein